MDYTLLVNLNLEVLNVIMGFLFSLMDLIIKEDSNRTNLKGRANISKLIMVQSTKVVGMIINLMVMENKLIKMEVNTKDGSRKERNKVKESLNGLMENYTLENSI